MEVLFRMELPFRGLQGRYSMAGHRMEVRVGAYAWEVGVCAL
jgi:hypothetical protein